MKIEGKAVTAGQYAERDYQAKGDRPAGTFRHFDLVMDVGPDRISVVMPVDNPASCPDIARGASVSVDVTRLNLLGPGMYECRGVISLKA